VCLYVNPSIVTRQRLDNNFTTAINTPTYEKIEEFLDASFSIRSVRLKGKAIRFPQNCLLI
jgi:hypothetical protein